MNTVKRVPLLSLRFSFEISPGKRHCIRVHRKILFRLLPAVFFLAAALNLCAQGTAISYQGRLNEAGVPANTNYDFRFTIYTAVTAGTNVSYALTNFAVPVSNGLFTTTLDFGSGVFNGTINGSNYWLDIGVRAIGATNFTVLTPRQPILPVPYAIFATGASNLLGTLQSTQLVGFISASLLSGNYTNGVNFSNATNIFNGVFSGNGTNLNNLNGSQITGGTIADARLTTNVALLNRSQTFSGTNTFNGTNYFNGINVFTNNGNYFQGSFFGNGLVGWLAVNGTYTNAMRDAGYMLLNPGLTTVQLPTAAQLLPGDIVRISGAGAGGWLVQENSGQSIMGNFASFRNCFLLPASPSGDWRRMCCSSDGTRMFAGGNGFSQAVYYSTDFGHSWFATTGGGANWCSVGCSANGNIIFAAPTGVANPIQMSSNGGLVFTNISGSTAIWSALACSADGSKFIASVANGSLYVWMNNTLYTAWTGTYNWSAAACSGDGSNLVAAVAGGNMVTSVNGGSFTTIAAPGSVTALAAAASGQKLVAAWLGGISTSTNFGTTWTPTTAPATNWSCVAASSDCSRLVAGVSNGLFYASANFGATWTALTTTNQFWSGACMSGDGSKFAGTTATVGVTGGIFYSGTTAQPNTISTNSTISGSQGSAVELQYLGNGQFMPVSSTGLIWAN